MDSIPGWGTYEKSQIDVSLSCSLPSPKINNHILKYILLIMLLQLSHFLNPLYSPIPCTTSPPTRILPPLSLCLWVLHISSLASPFPTLFLTFPCLFCTYHLCFLFPVPLSPFSPLPLHPVNPPCDLHISDSVPVLVVCLVCFCFCFRFSC